jgi:hypothetical protein
MCTPECPPSSSENESSIDYLLKRRIEEIGLNFRASWSTYITFYTIFLTFTGVAMGWSIQNIGEGKTLYIRVLACVFTMQSVLTAITSFRMATYSMKAGDDYSSNEIAILILKTLDPKTLDPKTVDPKTPLGILLTTKAIPDKLAYWAGIFNTVAMTATVVGWIWIAFGTWIVAHLLS